MIKNKNKLYSPGAILEWLNLNRYKKTLRIHAYYKRLKFNPFILCRR